MKPVGEIRHFKSKSGGQYPYVVFPHPDYPYYYVAIHSSVSSGGVVWGSHLDMELLSVVVLRPSVEG